MSFSSDTKKELCKFNFKKQKFKEIEMYGILLFCKNFTEDAIVFITRKPYIKDLIVKLIVDITGSIVDVKTKLSNKKGQSNFNIEMKNKEDIDKLISILKENFNLENSIIDCSLNIKNNMSHFLRGAFISCGTISNPNKDYRLEFIVHNKKLADFLIDIISNIKEFKFRPNFTYRRGQYVVYIKESESVADFLVYIGANIASMELMQVKMLKEVRNYVNRTTNFQTANISKTASASAIQIQSIEFIKEKKGLEFLPDNLREIAVIRLENPDMSLKEIGELFSKPLSRSTVNYRLKKIIEISNEIECDNN